MHRRRHFTHVPKSSVFDGHACGAWTVPIAKQLKPVRRLPRAAASCCRIGRAMHSRTLHGVCSSGSLPVDDEDARGCRTRHGSRGAMATAAATVGECQRDMLQPSQRHRCHSEGGIARAAEHVKTDARGAMHLVSVTRTWTFIRLPFMQYRVRRTDVTIDVSRDVPPHGCVTGRRLRLCRTVAHVRITCESL